MSTETEGIRVIVREERATYDAVRLLADVASAQRRAEAAREAARLARVTARERRAEAAREARRAREGAMADDAIARLARETGDHELASAAARHAACERSNARVASRRADPGAARHEARAARAWDMRRDGAREAAAEAIATVATGHATRAYGVTVRSVAAVRADLAAAERLPTTTRRERRDRAKRIHNLQRELRAALH